jgi:hypothetical protein
MTALCTTADIEALAGWTIPPEQQANVARLIEMASAVVGNACLKPLPDPTPDEVALVTAQLVVRQLANPVQADTEQIGQYRASFKSTAMALTDSDYDTLGSWAAPPVGRRAYSSWTPSPWAVDDAMLDPSDGWWIDAPIPMGEAKA